MGQMNENMELEQMREQLALLREKLKQQEIGFISFLIEETKGAFPTWLAPMQVKILPITDAHHEYARKLEAELRKMKVRVEVDDRSEKTGYKIREAQLEKVPYMLVVGAQEVEGNLVAVRSRKDGDIGQMSFEEFKQKLQDEIESKSI